MVNKTPTNGIQNNFTLDTNSPSQKLPLSSNLPLPVRDPLPENPKMFHFINLSDSIKELKTLAGTLLNLAGKVSGFFKEKGFQLLASSNNAPVKSEVQNPTMAAVPKYTPASSAAPAKKLNIVFNSAPIYAEISDSHSTYVKNLKNYIDLKPWESLSELISSEDAAVLKEGWQELHAFENQWAEKFLALKDPSTSLEEKAKIVKDYASPENREQLLTLYSKVNANSDKARVIIADLQDTLFIVGEEAVKKKGELTPREKVAADYFLSKTDPKHVQTTPIAKILMTDFNSLIIAPVQRLPRIETFSKDLTSKGAADKKQTEAIGETIKKINSRLPIQEASRRDELMRLSSLLNGSTADFKVQYQEGQWSLEERSTLISNIPLVGSSRVGRSQEAVNTFTRLFELSQITSDRKVFQAVYDKFTRTEWFQEAKNNNPQLQAIETLIQGNLNGTSVKDFSKIMTDIKNNKAKIEGQKLALQDGVLVFTNREAGLDSRKGGVNSQAALLVLLGLAKPLYEKNKTDPFNRNIDLQLKELQGFLRDNDWAKTAYNNLSPELKKDFSFLENYSNDQISMAKSITDDLKKLPQATPSERKMILNTLLFSERLSAAIDDSPELKAEFDKNLASFMNLKADDLAEYFLIDNPHGVSKQAFIDGYRRYMSTDKLLSLLNRLYIDNPDTIGKDGFVKSVQDEILGVATAWFQGNKNEPAIGNGPVYDIVRGLKEDDKRMKKTATPDAPNQEAIADLKAQFARGITNANREFLMEQMVEGVSRQSARLVGKLSMAMFTKPELKLDRSNTYDRAHLNLSSNADKLARFVTEQVLEGYYDHELSPKVKFFTDAASQLFEKGDYYGAQSIFAGLSDVSVRRLMPSMPSLEKDTDYQAKTQKLEAAFSKTNSPSLKAHMNGKTSFIPPMSVFNNQLNGAYNNEPFLGNGNFNVRSLPVLNSVLNMLRKLPPVKDEKQLFEYLIDANDQKTAKEWETQFTQRSESIIPRKRTV